MLPVRPVRDRLGLSRVVFAFALAALVALGAGPGAAGASIGAPAARVSILASDGPVLLAAGKNFRAPSAKPPKRGSSAELHGGSSADRYGGSSADRSGVAGRRDIRNRGAHAWRQRSRSDRPAQRERRPSDEANEREELQEQEGGDRQVLEYGFGGRSRK